MYLKFGMMKEKKTMVFNITKASDWEYRDTKEFNSLEELRDFVKKEYAFKDTPACVLYFP